jgi:hypothetical protein
MIWTMEPNEIHIVEVGSGNQKEFQVKQVEIIPCRHTDNYVQDSAHVETESNTREMIVH